ncbi:cation acetate symporter [Streptomyces chartreusis]|uniref:Cation acetate symporter n=2 Tax=Streptomyces chartreusis TaxID=1969 RepID=A0A7H8TME1_STRCX|nr:cation acetate symporter [Streptomyces chartreusis]
MTFLIFIGLSLLCVFMLATQKDHPESLYIADRSLSPVFNGFALAGEQISIAVLIAIPGAITLFGYDGFSAAIDSFISIAVLLLLSQKIRNSGLYTLGGLFSMRASGPAPRIAATLVTLTITIPILLIQLRAAGIITALLIGMSTDEAQVICTILMGCLVTCFAVVADLRGTSFLQVVKVPITLVTLAVITLLALKKFDWDPGTLLAAAVDKSVSPDEFLSPGLWPYASLGSLNTFGDHMVLILGTAVMPHLLLRISASSTGRSARRSMSIAAGLVGAFFLLLITTGFAAAAVVGSRRIGAADPIGQSSLIWLSSAVLSDDSGIRTSLITVVACVSFLAVLTTVTSVTFAAAVSFAHDVFAQSTHSHAAEVRFLRLAVFILCAGGLSLSAATHNYPVEFLITFSTSIAASCIFPALICSFFWRRFNSRGLLWSVYGGLILCITLTIFSPAVSGTNYALWPEANFDWYPFQSPGLISVPAAFILGWLGSKRPQRDTGNDFRSIQYRITTGNEFGPGAAD